MTKQNLQILEIAIFEQTNVLGYSLEIYEIFCLITMTSLSLKNIEIVNNFV